MSEIIQHDETLEEVAQDYIKDLNRREQHALREKLYDALYQEIILGEEPELDEELEELYEEFQYLGEEIEPAYLRAELFQRLHEQYQQEEQQQLQKEQEREKLSWIAQHAQDVREGVSELEIPDWGEGKVDWIEQYQPEDSWVEKKNKKKEKK